MREKRMRRRTTKEAVTKQEEYERSEEDYGPQATESESNVSLIRSNTKQRLNRAELHCDLFLEANTRAITRTIRITEGVSLRIRKDSHSAKYWGPIRKKTATWRMREIDPRLLHRNNNRGTFFNLKF